MTDLVVAADTSIFLAIRDDHHDFDDGWMDLVPEDSPLNYIDGLDWLHFLTAVVRRYRFRIAPCSCPNAVHFYGYKSKELNELRDALVEETICP
ncbi:MAG: hypothetical protein ACKOQM_06245 [Novosphingobium sp.]